MDRHRLFVQALSTPLIMRFSTALCGLLPFTLFHATLSFAIKPICTSSFQSNTRILVVTTEAHDFMVRMDETPRGELRDDQVETLRNLMSEFATTATEESAQMSEKILLRMVDEWPANPESSAVPTTDDFYTVRKEKSHLNGSSTILIPTYSHMSLLCRLSLLGRKVRARKPQSTLAFSFSKKRISLKRA